MKRAMLIFKRYATKTKLLRHVGRFFRLAASADSAFLLFSSSFCIIFRLFMWANLPLKSEMGSGHGDDRDRDSNPRIPYFTVQKGFGWLVRTPDSGSGTTSPATVVMVSVPYFTVQKEYGWLVRYEDSTGGAVRHRKRTPM